MQVALRALVLLLERGAAPGAVLRKQPCAVGLALYAAYVTQQAAARPARLLSANTGSLGGASRVCSEYATTYVNATTHAPTARRARGGARRDEAPRARCVLPSFWA
jgi:hypothetical protein